MNTQIDSQKSLVDGIDHQIALIDGMIATYKSMLSQLSEMQSKLDDMGRIIKANDAITSNKVNLDISPDGDFYMTSFSDPSTMYEVCWFSCDCPDHVYRHKVCKHMIAFRSLSDEKRLADLEAEAMQARADLGL